MKWLLTVLKNLFAQTDSIESITKDFTDIATRLEGLAGIHSAKVDALKDELEDHAARANKAIRLAANFKGLVGIQ